MEQTLVTRIVEAALLAANQPLTLVQLQALFPLDEPAPEGGIERALEQLQAQSAERGVELVEIASGWRFQVQADVHPWVARLWSERQTKYTRATLETLALIAYRQPITRGEIEQIRGVAVNSNIIKALEEREWIRVIGHRDMPGRPELLGTTKGFLDYFGLKRLDELPPLSELKDFGELDPQLQFDGGPIVVDNIADLGNEAGAEAQAGDGGTPADETGTGGDTEADADAAADSDSDSDSDDIDNEEARSPHARDDADEAGNGDAGEHGATRQDDRALEQDRQTTTNALAADGDSTGAGHE